MYVWQPDKSCRQIPVASLIDKLQLKIKGNDGDGGGDGDDHGYHYYLRDPLWLCN